MLSNKSLTLIHKHVYTPTERSAVRREQPAHRGQVGARRLAQGRRHAQLGRNQGSNRQPSSARRQCPTSWAAAKHREDEVFVVPREDTGHLPGIQPNGQAQGYIMTPGAMTARHLDGRRKHPAHYCCHTANVMFILPRLYSAFMLYTIPIFNTYITIPIFYTTIPL